MFLSPCCPVLLNCVDVDVHAVVLLGKKDDDDDFVKLYSETGMV